MIISKIKAQNLKTADFAHDLDTVTIFTGPNGAGKTARMEAIRLALLGYAPEHGKQNQMTLGLCRNGTLKVEAHVGDTVLARTWSKGAKAVTRQEYGELEIPPVLMDPAVFFELGPKDQVRYICALAAPDEDTIVQRLLARIAAPLSAPLNVMDAVAQVKAGMESGAVECHDRGQDVMEWLAEQAASLREQLTTHQREAKACAGLVGTLVDGQAPMDPRRDIIKTENELAAARKTLEDLAGKHVALTLKAKQAEVSRAALDRLPMAMAALAKAEAALADHPAPEKGPDDLEKIRRTAALAHTKACQALATAKAEMQQNLAASGENREALDNLQKMECCPYCRSKGRGWKVTLEKNLLKTNEELEAKTEELKGKIKTLETDLAKARLAETSANQALKHHHQAAMEHASAAGEVFRLRAEMERFTEHKAAVAGAPTEEEVDQAAQAVGEAEAAAAAIQLRVAGLRHALDVWTRWDQNRRTQSEAVLRKQKHESMAEAYKLALDAVEETQRMVSWETMTTVLERANVITDNALGIRLEMRDGVLGAQRGPSSVWVSHRTFSGTEKAVCYAAISLALGWNSPVRIVLLDELGRLDDRNKKAVVTVMQDLIQSGHIHQFIGADTDPAPYREMGVKVIEV
mgnify:CR=1 FL=1